MTSIASFVPLRELLAIWDEPGIAPVDSEGILDRVGIDDFNIVEVPGSVKMTLMLTFLDELGFGFPAINGLGLYFGSSGKSTTITAEADIGLQSTLSLLNTSIILRLPPTLIKSVIRNGDRFEVVHLPDGSIAPYEIKLEGINATYDGANFDIIFPTGTPLISPTPMMIGDTDIIIECTGIGFYFNRNATPPPDQNPGFQGIYIDEAMIHLPDGFSALPGSLKFQKCSIGSGGFSGRTTADWTDKPLRIRFLWNEDYIKDSHYRVSSKCACRIRDSWCA